MSETTMINHAANHGELIASDRVEGTAVYNRQGEKLGKISKPESPVELYVIPTNEEIMIARDTLKLIQAQA